MAGTPLSACLSKTGEQNQLLPDPTRQEIFERSGEEQR